MYRLICQTELKHDKCYEHLLSRVMCRILFAKMVYILLMQDKEIP